MKAMIFAAGLGTRLKPLTNSTPKALVKVHDKPMLEWVILKLKKSGITNIIINVHHFADQVISFLNSKNNFGLSIEISHESELLDTGGGLKKAAWFFKGESDILVHNTDVISEIDLQQLYLDHKNNNSDATVCVRSRKTNRYFLFDNNNQLCGWTSKKENRTLWVTNPVKSFREVSFCGIQIISYRLLENFDSRKIFSIIPEYLKWATNYKIRSYDSDVMKWIDLGKKENIHSVKDIFDENYFLNLSK